MNAKDAYTIAALFGQMGQRGVNPARDAQNAAVVSQAQAGIQNEIAKEMEKKKKKGRGIFGTVGKMVGTGAGFMLGGPVGAAAGSMIGSAGGTLAEGGQIDPAQLAFDGISGGAQGYNMKAAGLGGGGVESGADVGAGMEPPDMTGVGGGSKVPAFSDDGLSVDPGLAKTRLSATPTTPAPSFGNKFFGGMAYQMGYPTQRKRGYVQMPDGTWVYYP